MMYRLLADMVLVLHLAFVLWVVLGWLAVRRWRWVMWLHLRFAAYGALIELVGWQCPLTPLEQHLRRLGGEAGFEGGFIEHYLEFLLYPGWLDHTVQILLGIAVPLVNAGGYWWALRGGSSSALQSPTKRHRSKLYKDQHHRGA
jgi:hypothetical protein